MTTVILSALLDEQRHLIDRLSARRTVQVAGREVAVGRLSGQPVVLALSRIGKVAAATTATALIEHFAPARVVFTGVAGGLGDGVRVGDMVLATAFLQHDLDASPLFPRWEVPLYGRARFEADASLGAALRAAAEMVLARSADWLDARLRNTYRIEQPRLHTGLVLSGDRFVATAAESSALRTALPDALAVEMEGAAVAQVCADFGLPFAALRTISDRADDSAHADFSTFVRDVASHYSDAVLQTWLESL